MKLEPGATIGPYTIVDQLGKGGMATVYKALQPSLSRYVAIKVLPEFLAEEPGFAERFQQEAVAVAKLRHPNILAVFDYGNQDNVAYIVTEFLDGGTLADQAGKPLPVEYVASGLRRVASALDYAHARGILHRDIKPSNILLSHDGTPVLADFGLAKMLERSGPGLTQSGMIVGTPEYMAPEQGMGQEVGPAADIYSLSVVAYELLTGRPPFTAPTPAAVMVAAMHNELPPPRSINPALSPEVEAVLVKGLAREPSARYRTAGELSRALTDASAGADVEYAAGSPPTPVPPVTPRPTPLATPAPISSPPATPPVMPMTPPATPAPQYSPPATQPSLAPPTPPPSYPATPQYAPQQQYQPPSPSYPQYSQQGYAQGAYQQPYAYPARQAGRRGFSMWWLIGAGVLIFLVLAASTIAFAVRNNFGSSGPSASPAACGFLQPAGAVRAGLGGTSCGVQLGEVKFQADCTKLTSLPQGVQTVATDKDGNTGGGGTVDLSKNRCRMTAPTDGSDIRLRLNDLFGEAAVVADFEPGPQTAGRIGVTFRCRNGCIDVGVYPDGGYFVSEKVGSGGTYKDLVNKKDQPLATGKPTRMVITLQSQVVKLWLNGRLVTTVTTAVPQVDGPMFLYTTDESGSAAAVMDLYRLFVLAPGAPAAGCALLKVGAAVAAGSATKECGFQVGEAVAGLDCEQATGPPAGMNVDSYNYAKNTSGGGTVSYGDGLCKVGAPAYDVLTEFRLTGSTPADLVAVADFIPTAGGNGYTGFTFRCTGGTCLFAYVVHAGTFYVEDLLKGESTPTEVKTASASVQLNQSNRLVAWIRKQKLDLWLNGQLLTSVTVRLDQPAGTDLAQSTSFFIENYEKSSGEQVNLQRFYVFKAA